MLKKSLLLGIILIFCAGLLSAQTAEAPSVGDGSSDNPYQIATLGNLRWLSENPDMWASVFIQTANIDASETSGWDDGDGDNPEGWKPIGNEANPFTGSYDGQNYYIDSLYIYRPSTSYVALFGFTNGSEIKNVLINFSNITGYSNVAALVGYNSGYVENSATRGHIEGKNIYTGGLIGQNHSSATVNGCTNYRSEIKGTGYIGGLIGCNYGNIFGHKVYYTNVEGTEYYVGGFVGMNYGRILNCQSNGVISGNSFHYGGFVGLNHGNIDNCSSNSSVQGIGSIGGFAGTGGGTINCCYSSGSVNGSAEVGGFAGILTGDTYNCYSYSTVTGTDKVGGFSGLAGDGGSINNCYSIGKVTGSSNTGGFLGLTGPLTVNSCFWDIESSGLVTSVDGTGKTTAEMKTLSTFTEAGWDFEIETKNGTNNFWDMDESDSLNNGYPFLSWQNGTQSIALHNRFIYVSTYGSDVVSIGLESAPFASIQAAIDYSQNGDTVLVQPGTYVENIDFNGKDIVLGSLYLTTQDTSYISQTIIDGNGNGSVVSLKNGENNSCSIIGLAIRNGSGVPAADSTGGSGFYIMSSSPKIEHCKIINNTGFNGSAFYIRYSSPIITDCEMSNNIGTHVSYSTTLYIRDSSPIITNSKIINNIGMGIYSYGCQGLYENNYFINNTSTPIWFNAGDIVRNSTFINNGESINIWNGKLENCLVVNNRSTGILTWWDSSVELVNVTVANNQGTGVENLGNLTIINSIIKNNSTPIKNTNSGTITVYYSNIDSCDIILGEGNINKDPLFVDPANINYALSDNSPCIGTGLDTSIVPTTDLEGNPRPNPSGSNPDMGAYENPLGEFFNFIWTIRLSAETGIYNDNMNYIGVATDATSGFDPDFDEVEAPLSPGSSISLYFSHTEWGIPLSDNFSKDIKANIDTVQFWDFKVVSTETDTVSILFDFFNVPNVPVILEDKADNTKYSLSSGDTFNFISEANVIYTFSISVGDTIAPEIILGPEFSGPAIRHSNNVQKLTWSASDNISIDKGELWFSADSGNNFNLINSFDGNKEYYDWIIPDCTLIYNGLLKLKIWDYAGNMAEVKSNHIFAIVGDSLGTMVYAGWNLWGAPLEADKSYIPNNLDDNFTSYYIVYEYQNNGYLFADALDVAQGYWLGTVEDATVDIIGHPLTDEYELPLNNGWNLISNPLVIPVYIDSLRFTKSEEIKSYAEAVTAGWVNHIYAYESTGGYQYASQTDPWKGYWMGILQDNISVTFPIHKNPPEILGKQSIIVPSLIRFHADAGNMSHDLLAIGTHDDAGHGFDFEFDAIAPPMPPGSKYLSVYVPRTDLSDLVLGNRFLRDIRSTIYGENIKEWLIQLETNEASARVTWSIENIPDNLEVGIDIQGLGYFEDMRTLEYITVQQGGSFRVRLGSSVVGVADDLIPEAYELGDNYPNPFNPLTTIHYALPEAATVSLIVYDIAGRAVRTLINSEQSAGYRSIAWDGRNDAGRQLGSGMYIYRLQANDFVDTKKMVFMK